MTKIEPGKAFYPAEEHHQDFLARNPNYPYIAVNDIPKVEASGEDVSRPLQVRSGAGRRHGAVELRKICGRQPRSISEVVQRTMARVETRDSPTSTSKVVAPRIIVSVAASKMAPRSDSEKMRTGSVTQPGG